MRPARLIRSLALGAVALGAVAAVVRHMHGPVGDRGDAQTDIEMGNVWLYDIVSRFLWAPMFRGIANDVASNLETDGRILEVGCGPGHLATRLALIPGTSVTATDIDPRMVERAVANAVRALPPGDQPTFATADVAHLPFDDGTFDLVVSTFSMHHWADPPAGLAEMKRGRFAVLTTIGSAVWVALIAGLGYAAGRNWNHVSKDFHAAELPIIVVVVLALAFGLWHRVRTVRRHNAS